MTPVRFNFANRSLNDLPVFTNGRECISCWQPSWPERFSVLLFGRVWVSAIGRSLPAMNVEASRTLIESEPSKKKFHLPSEGGRP